LVCPITMATHCRTHVWETVLAGKWRQIGDASLQDALEAAFSAASDGYQFDARGYAYEIDFGRMVQSNKSTKRERKLRRVLAPAAVPAAPAVAVAAPAGAVPAVVAPPAAVATRCRTKAVGAPVPKAKAVPAPVSSGKPSPAPSAAPAILASAVPKSAGPPRPQGTVKSFFKEKGYGFISLDSGDVFFHLTALVGDSVRPNDTVEVLLAKDRAGRSRASEVRVLKRPSIYRMMCRDKCCQAKGDRHFEDRCPRRLRGDDSSVSTATS